MPPERRLSAYSLPGFHSGTTVGAVVGGSIREGGDRGYLEGTIWLQRKAPRIQHHSVEPENNCRCWILVTAQIDNVTNLSRRNYFHQIILMSP